MSTVYRASYVSLHVRRSNKAAIGLYQKTLKFKEDKIEKSYCEFACLARFHSIPHGIRKSLLTMPFENLDADGEDAYAMRLKFDPAS
jgi:ribosomal protein S18 acetylase RimI-like enzyme